MMKYKYILSVIEFLTIQLDIYNHISWQKIYEIIDYTIVAWREVLWQVRQQWKCWPLVSIYATANDLSRIRASS